MPELTITSANLSPDIMAFTETWLHSGILDAEVHLPSYQLIRRDRVPGRRGGGVALYIKEQLRAQTINLQISAFTTNFELIGCKIITQSGPVNVFAVYRSPSSNETDDDALLMTLRQTANLPGELLLLGDFNAPSVNWETWTCDSPRSFSGKLLEFAEYQFLNQAVTEPTRFRLGNQPSLLDLVFHKFPTSISDLTSLAPLGKSDHAIIRFSFAL